jgi:hypothetical protein
MRLKSLMRLGLAAACGQTCIRIVKLFSVRLDPHQIEFYGSGDGTPDLAFMYAKQSQRVLANICVDANETRVRADGDLVHDLRGQPMRRAQVLTDLPTAIAAEFGLWRGKKLKFSARPSPAYRCVVC